MPFFYFRIFYEEDGIIYLKNLSQVHLDLQWLFKLMEKFYRAPILFFSYTHFMNLTTYFYRLCLHFEKEDWEYSHIKDYWMLSFWLVIHLIESVMTIEIVNSTVNEGNKTGSLIHRIPLPQDDKYIINMVNNILNF